MTGQAADRPDEVTVPDEFRNDHLRKLAEWVEQLGADADVVFMSCACGQHQLTPRNIFEQARDRHPDGEAYLRSAWELESYHRRKDAEAARLDEPTESVQLNGS